MWQLAHTRGVWIGLVLLLACLGHSQEAWAVCEVPHGLERFAEVADPALRCAQAPSDCHAEWREPLPGADCVDQAAVALFELLAGEGPGSARRSDPASRCQREIVRASRGYLTRRIRLRLRGRRGAPRAPFLRRVEAACSEVPVHVSAAGRLPASGGACATIVDDRGERIDGPALARCLSGAIEGVIDAVAPQRMRPNIVVVLTDDQEGRVDSVRHMPATLDRLAAQGVHFENGFVTTPVCGPSRASLLSGQYASRHGVRSNASLVFGDHDFDEDRTVGRWLQEAGYRTAFIGKYQNWIFAREPRVPLGWDDWRVFRNPRYYHYTLNENGTLVEYADAPGDYSTDVLAAKALDFIAEHHEEPFFLVLSVLAPHTPAIPADRHRGRLGGLAPARPPNFREPDLAGKPAWVRFQRLVAGPEASIDRRRIDMLETLLSVDEAVDGLLDALAARGLTDNTLFVFTSDNGLHHGAHWWDGKWTGYEESLRVPFIVRYPAAAPAPRSDQALVLNIDLAPTFVDLAALERPIPMDVDGVSLVERLSGGPPPRDAFAFESFDSFVVRPMRGVRDARFKYIRQTGTAFEELYDLQVDPWELTSLAARPEYQPSLPWFRARLAELLGGD